MVNRGYATEDDEIVDYALWAPTPGIPAIRGPSWSELPSRYAVAIGAAQTFGRFVQAPYPSILTSALGLPVLNLGYSGAGPQFFLERPGLLKLIDGASLAIVQVLSARSVSNSVFEVGVNNAMLRRRDAPDEPFVFAEDAYVRAINELHPSELARLRVEVRIRFGDEMEALLRRVHIPKLLFYFSTRSPEYRETLSEIGGYWGAFPHFVCRGTIDRLREYADDYVELTSDAGLPQPLVSRRTGAPVEIWDAARFPRARFRCHNAFYPSPEMHAQAADALAPRARALVEPVSQPDVRPSPMRSRERLVIVHASAHLSSPPSLDASLLRTFGDTFAPWTAVAGEASDGAALRDFVRTHRELRAVRAIGLRGPMSGQDDLCVQSVVCLRDPIERAFAVYEHERQRPSNVTTPHANHARTLDFDDFVEWCLSSPQGAAPIADHQVRMLSARFAHGEPAAWTEPVSEIDLRESLFWLTSDGVRAFRTEPSATMPLKSLATLRKLSGANGHDLEAIAALTRSGGFDSFSPEAIPWGSITTPTNRTLCR